jgi:parallel beta-helix repeat protein
MSRMVTLLLALALFITTPAVFGTTIHVPADQPTIQAGINAGSNDDTVLVQPGTYVENINFSGRNIVLGSLFLTTGYTSYISSTIIDGDSSGTVVKFENGEASTAVITGFTIQNGFDTYGGGIYCASSDPEISNNIIRDNFAIYNGGGINCDNSNSKISNNTISENSADSGSGGGIFCVNSNVAINNNTIQGNSAADFGGPGGGGISFVYCTNPTITDNIIIDNYAYSGGGIDCFDSDPTISGNTIIDNLADGGGGIGLCCTSAGTINNNTISDNEAYSMGGGIYCNSGTITTISDNIINRNRASGAFSYGGAICCNESDPPITNNIVNGNSADNGGGISCRTGSSGLIDNNTISGNSATNSGGGIHCHDNSNPTINGNTISNNSSDAGGGINLGNSNATISHNVLTKNQVLYEGGALSLWVCSNPVIVSNTFVSNTAGYGGGAMFICNSSPTIDKCLVAFNNGSGAITCATGCPPSSPDLFCTNVFGNTGGDWVGCIAGQAGINGNLSLDPLFCDTASSDYSLFVLSPCAPANNSCGVLIGALDVGCTGPKALIDPDTMYIFQSHIIDTIMAVIYFGDFTDGHTIDDVDPASLSINSTITPTSWDTLTSFPGFVGEVMEITFTIQDFILGYGPLWDTSIQVYTVSGEFNDKSGFSIDGEVTMFGHTSGDINGDGAVNVGDLTYLVDFLFNGGAEPPVPETADLDHNGAINVADVTELVNLIFE